MIVLSLFLVAISSEPNRLSGEDLSAYRSALTASPDRPARSVSFSDLWTHAESHRGDRIRVEGRLVRRFETGPSIEFPARVEMWLATPSNNLFCIVFPAGHVDLPVGSLLAFEGTSLGQVRFTSGNGDRMAPLVVGSQPPRPVAEVSGSLRGVSAEGMIGVVAAAIVLLALVRARLNRPSRPLPETGPGVEFES